MVNLRIYVHDLKKTIGHSRALIEIINHLNQNDISSIDIVSFTCDPIDELFPDLGERTRFHAVPFAHIKPVLFKVLFYQFYCLFDHFFNAKEKTQTISIGLANPFASIFYIQFIHNQWKKRYLAKFEGASLKKIYKKMLYNYLCLVESISYKNTKKQYICVADFMAKFLADKLHTPEHAISLVYSGANLEEFTFNEDSKARAIESLSEHHALPTELLTTKKPLFLFVGAFERKGLEEAINWLSEIKDQVEFIVVGEAERGSKLSNLPDWITVVSFTNEIKHFYAIADYFIFPTHYEPFGLVLLEAFAMGCQILTNYNEVGASELLRGIDKVSFFDQETLKPSEYLNKLTNAERVKISIERAELFRDKQWSDRAREFREVIQRDFDNNLLSYLS